MRIGVLGTGSVGTTLATKLVALGHEVCMGSRSADHEGATEWAHPHGGRASNGTFSDAASYGEILVVATRGDATIDVLQTAGAEHLAGKVVVDVTNPLDTSAGFPPTLAVCNDDSLGEQVQREFTEARVVKTLNTVNASVMVAPQTIGTPTSVFMSGDDPAAKSVVRGLLGQLGWTDDQILDLGGIESARGAEMYLALWIRLVGAVGHPRFNVAVQRCVD